MTKELLISEIPDEDGNLKFRYARYKSEDGTKCIRHGRFEAYYPNGQLSSEGSYEDGAETGLWKDYHDNGVQAAQGTFVNGKKAEDWIYWGLDDSPEQ